MEAEVLQHSRLLKLPAEIRDQIYVLALSDEKQLQFVLEKKWDKWSLEEWQRFGGLDQPHLSCVCRQLRREVLPIFYSELELRIDMSYSFFARIPGWWLETPAWKAASKHVTEVQVMLGLKNPKPSEDVYHGTPNTPGFCSDKAVLQLTAKPPGHELRVEPSDCCDDDEDLLGLRCCCKIRAHAQEIELGEVDLVSGSKMTTLLEWLDLEVLPRLKVSHWDENRRCPTCEKVTFER